MPHPNTTRKPLARQWRLVALLACAAPLAACSGADRVVTASVEPPDFRARHPIEISRGRAALDVLPEVRNGDIDAPETVALNVV